VSGAPLVGYNQTNLVSSVPGLAVTTDPNLINPWGIATTGSSPFWVANQGSSTSTLYNGAGAKQALTVNTTGSPTGVVANTNASVFNGDIFIFATLGGTITGWRGALGTNAEVLSLGNGGSYTGLALGSTANGTYLYAADSKNNQVVVLPSSGSPALSGNFVDPNLPAGFSIYNIQFLAGILYVTYENETLGGGVVDKFSLNGDFLQRLSANGSGGPLDSPWGLAIAPSNFGPASGALLVGNEANGMINAFDSTTGAFLGTLADPSGNPIINTGLWGLRVGNGGNGGDPNKLYFAAGINEEQAGLFGAVEFVPEPSTLWMISVGLFLGALTLRRKA